MNQKPTVTQIVMQTNELVAPAALIETTVQDLLDEGWIETRREFVAWGAYKIDGKKHYGHIIKVNFKRHATRQDGEIVAINSKPVEGRPEFFTPAERRDSVRVLDEQIDNLLNRPGGHGPWIGIEMAVVQLLRLRADFLFEDTKERELAQCSVSEIRSHVIFLYAPGVGTLADGAYQLAGDQAPRGVGPFLSLMRLFVSKVHEAHSEILEEMLSDTDSTTSEDRFQEALSDADSTTSEDRFLETLDASFDELPLDRLVGPLGEAITHYFGEGQAQDLLDYLREIEGQKLSPEVLVKVALERDWGPFAATWMLMRHFNIELVQAKALASYAYFNFAIAKAIDGKFDSDEVKTWMLELSKPPVTQLHPTHPGIPVTIHPSHDYPFSGPGAMCRACGMGASSSPCPKAAGNDRKEG